MAKRSERPPRPDKEAVKDLATALKAARDTPDEADNWERAEELAEKIQRPDDVDKAYRAVLAGGISPELASEVGRRAVRFHETWFGDDSADLPGMLKRVLELDTEASWAFQRLTVALTSAEKWDELLGFYDEVIASAPDDARRKELLDEAAQVAKDFAAQPERAIGYLTQLYSLDSSNTALASSLERLLERQQRWDALVDFWRGRIDRVPPEQAGEARMRMAESLFEKLGDAPAAMAEIRVVLEREAKHAKAYRLLEKILAANGADAGARREALGLLKQRFEKEKKAKEVIRVLESSLDYARDDERKAALGELVERHTTAKNHERAFEHQAELMVLEPTGEVQELLGLLAEKTRQFVGYADALVRAADACADAERANRLVWDAAVAREQQAGDARGAVELYQRVLRAELQPGLTVQSARALNGLLGKTDRLSEQLEALEALALLEPEATDRREVLGQLARLADRMDNPERAVEAWKKRLSMDGADLEALDALAEAHEKSGQWLPLIEVLRQRALGPVPAARRRRDLVRIASVFSDQLEDLEPAIDVWREVQQSFGEDAESIAALTDLLARTERWPELGELLEGAAGRETARFAELQVRLGDAYRQRLDRPEQAAECYRRTLQADPRHEQAREGLGALLQDDRTRAAATAALYEAYRRTDEWANVLKLMEYRIQTAESPADQAAILVQAAALYEQRGEDAAQALACLKRAFALVPDDRSAEKEIRRLAETLDDWQSVVKAYRDTIAALTPGSARAAELCFQEGVVLENQLSDTQGALDAYSRAAAIAPDRVEIAEPAVRIAASSGQWERAAGFLVVCMRGCGRLVPSLLETVEQIAAASEWDSLARAMNAELGAEAIQPPELGRELWRRLGTWHVERRNDADAAEAALLRAVAAQGGHAPTLRMLADLQRRSPSRALVDSLLALAELEARNLDTLCEAADVARQAAGDVELETSILQRLYEAAVALLKQGAEAVGEQSAHSCARRAVERLVEIHTGASAHGRALDLLADASRLALAAEVTQGLRHQAAELAVLLGDTGRAGELYREVVERDPEDRRAVQQLALLYEKQERLAELLAMKQHELSLDVGDARKLELRLEAAGIFSRLEERIGSLSCLLANLRQQPGHQPSIEAVSSFLLSKSRQVELANILAEQAEAMENAGETARAAELWWRVARLYEREICDPDKAVDSYCRHYRVIPGPDAPAALARLYSERESFSQAAEWLERRLAAVDEQDRTATAVELAETYLKANKPDSARESLERVLGDNPSEVRLRDLLAGIYREQKLWEKLAALQAGSAEQATEADRQLEYIREAADVYCCRLNEPERAVPVLQRAYELAPKDIALATLLADSLRVSGRLEEAGELLQGLIKGFGRKRSRERGELHFRLARVRRDEGDVKGAFEQLDTAVKMDHQHVGALGMQGELAREQGELERAERSYRALLLLFRQKPPAEGDAVGPSEAFYELSRVARERGNDDQAEELLESAFEAALGDEAEARRYQQLLRERDENELMLRLLDARLEEAAEPAQKAALLGARADALEGTPGCEAEALDARIRALELAPESENLHRGALASSQARGELQRYVDCLQSLAENEGRKTGKKARALAARLTLRLGEVVEKELGDLEQAAEIYGQVESSGELVEQAWLLLARIAGQRGDRQEQRRVLSALAELPPERVVPEARDQALFTLAEIDLADDATLDQGIEWLSRAMKSEPDLARTKGVLVQAVERTPAHAPLLALYQKVARQSGDKPMLLDYLARRSRLGDTTIEEMREGAQVAFDLGQPEQAEPLLDRALEIGRETEGGLAAHGWLFEALSECRERAGDVEGAMAVLQQAAESTPEEQAVAFTRRQARLAAGPGGDPEMAAAAYARLLARDPSDRNCWEPLLAIYRDLGDRERFEQLVVDTLEVLLEAEQRSELRMQHAAFLIEVVRAERDAVEVLQALLADDPDHLEGGRVLIGIYERQGMDEELADLLFRQFDRARDQRDAEAVVELGLRIGGLLEGNRPQDAVDTYRSALEFAPESRLLLQALMRALGDEADTRDRGEVQQRILATETGPTVEPMALELFELWRSIEDDEMAQQTLELGYRLYPEGQQLRYRLEGWYAEREQWPLFAEFMVAEASRAESVTEAVARFKNAASIYREQLGDTMRSAEALRMALELVPDDLTLLGELARNLAAAGEHRQAIDDVSSLLERNPQPDRTRIDLLRVRADLYLTVQEPASAVGDLEEAYDIAGDEVSGKLVDALFAARERGAAESDAGAERAASFRLVELLIESGDRAGARDVLAGWIERNQTDAEALGRLRDMDIEDERWPDVAQTCELLIEVAEGDDLAQAARMLARACEKAGQPEAARAGLEKVARALPDDQGVRDALRHIYEQTGANRELAAILQKDANATEDEARQLELLRRAAELLLEAGDAEAALAPLGQAQALPSADASVTAVLVDAYIKLERLDEASNILDKAIEGFKRKRSPELAMLQHRMARLAAVTGGPRMQLDWLSQAMETDRKSGEIASELVEIAMQLGEYDPAMKALRIITMMEDPHPMTRAVAFLRQAQIAHLTNDTRRAQHWARKAKQLDPDLAEADTFLKEIGAS